MKDTSVIPKGYYCYEITKIDNNPTEPEPENEKQLRIIFGQTERLGRVIETRICPYWSRSKDDLQNGSCSYLNISDNQRGGGLLFDQVKECGINLDEPDQSAS